MRNSHDDSGPHRASWFVSGLVLGLYVVRPILEWAITVLP